MKKISIGISNFKKIIENNFYYVDKTLFIKELINKATEVLLLPRPRRFGKTLNLSMLYYFFSNTEQAGHLFKDLLISSHTDCMEYQGKYPVIFITFKDIKCETWEKAYRDIAELINDLFTVHQDALLPVLAEQESEFYHAILKRKADETDYKISLKRLTVFLERAYKKKVIVLIDEYDAPIHAGYQHKYYQQVVSHPQLSRGLRRLGQSQRLP